MVHDDIDASILGLHIYVYWAIGLMSRVFANSLGV